MVLLPPWEFYWSKCYCKIKWHRLDWNPRQAWLKGWVFVYKLSVSGFVSSCSHLNFRFRGCFEQWVPCHSGNYRVWVHSETRTWHDKNIQSNTVKYLKRFWIIYNESPFLLLILCWWYFSCLQMYSLNFIKIYFYE